MRSLVCWESTVLISSAIGCRCGSLTGCPYISRSRSRIARTRRLSGRFQGSFGADPIARPVNARITMWLFRVSRVCTRCRQAAQGLGRPRAPDRRSSSASTSSTARSAASPTPSAPTRSPTATRSSTSSARRTPSSSPSLQAFFLPAHWIDRLRQPDLPQRPVLDRARLPGLALPLPQRVLLLRPQHVRGLDGPGADRLHALPDRAAADVPRATASSTRSTTSPTSTTTPALAKIFINPYAAVPSMHCAFALMIGGTGVMVCRHWCRESLLGLLAVAGRLGHDRHRQPLLGRRGAGLDGGAGRGAGRPAPGPARPEAWSFRGKAPHEAEA